jgi:GDPmannose 4,6-dehydratase
MKRALVLGSTGQDGQLLSDFLLKSGYEVFGASRNKPSLDINPLKLARPTHAKIDITEYQDLLKLIGDIKPQEIYNLSALSSVSSSFSNPSGAISSNVIGVLNLLNSIKNLNLQKFVKIFQPSSSDMFGPSNTKINESSPQYPKSPYGVAKLVAHQICLRYREQFGIQVSAGILFNHESELRSTRFVFQKIIRSLVEISLGRRKYIELGNLNVYRDWGYAGDHIQAMHKIMQQDDPCDYVIATGELHSLTDIIIQSCEYLSIKTEIESLVHINSMLTRPLDIERTWGDPSRINLELGWRANTSFIELIEKIVKFNLLQLNK